MNTWLMDIVVNANESVLSDSDISRLLSYYDTVPQRIRLGEEIERITQGLSKTLYNHIHKKYPDRSIYTKQFAQDIVDTLPFIYRSVLADDLKILHYCLIEQIYTICQYTNTEVRYIYDVYVALGDILKKNLTHMSWNLLTTAYSELLDALTRNNVTG